MKVLLASMKGKIIVALATCAVVVGGVVAVVSANAGIRQIAVSEVNGISDVAEGNSTKEAFVGMHLQRGNHVKVHEDSDLTLEIDSDKYLYAEPGTEFSIIAKGKEDSTKTEIRMSAGSTLNRIDKKLGPSESYEVSTPNATMSVRGTVYRVTISPAENGETLSQIEVFEGKVIARAVSEDGREICEEQEILPGQCAMIHSDSTFSEFVVFENGENVQEINYPEIPENTAKKLGLCMDSGRTLSIEKELLFDVTGVSEHAWKEVVTKASTCTEKGSAYMHCDICGSDTEETELALAEHDYLVTEDATEQVECTLVHHLTKVCKVCGEEDEEDVAQENHEVVEELVVSESTCEKQGEKEIHCKLCASIIAKEALPFANHVFGDVSVSEKPTCLLPGSGKAFCKNCKKEIVTIIPATGHTFSDWTTAQAATCTGGGKEVRSCTICEEKEEQSTPMAGHTGGEWKTVTAATCTKTGVKEQYCKVCNAKMSSETIATVPHSYGAWNVIVQPACETRGLQEHICKICGDNQRQLIPQNGHHLDAGRISHGNFNEAARTVDEYIDFQCSNCNFSPRDTYTRGISLDPVTKQYICGGCNANLGAASAG